jgi:membrane protein
VEELGSIPQPDASRQNGKAAVPRRRQLIKAWVRSVASSGSIIVRRTVRGVLALDFLNLAQSSAYSAIVALFPTLIVAAAVVGLIPETAPLRFQLARFFDRILPSVAAPLLDAYFQNSPKNTHSLRALGGAAVVSFLGASNVVVTLMEGLRRARGLPENCWSFWQRRRRSFELVPLSIVPLSIASVLVMFGHAVTMWVAANIGAEIRPWVYGGALLIRWGVALSASVGLIALVYHLGTPERRIGLDRRQAVYVEEDGEQHSILLPGAWFPVLPGAVVATAMWFVTTLVFGWYVTRFANYSEVYGSLGAGIALLFWLYIISLSVLSGAEFNTQFHAHFAEKKGLRRDEVEG